MANDAVSQNGQLEPAMRLCYSWLTDFILIGCDDSDNPMLCNSGRQAYQSWLSAGGHFPAY
jgi:hypothetical protein